MRLILTILFFISLDASATNKFLSLTGGSGAGTSAGTAWSPAYYTATGKNAIAPGDTVFLKRGETYPLLPVSTNNGNNTGRIVYSSYGTGAKPVISGMSTVTGWTALGGNIFYATVDVPRLQVVTVDGAVRGVGRYPNSGYLTIASHSGLTSFTAPTVSAIPGDPAGGEAVAKSARYILQRYAITSRSGNTLNISATNQFGYNDAYPIDDGNGYFVQNYVGALDLDGEWCYDAGQKRLYVYFASGNTTSHVIQAALSPTIINLQARSFIDFHNIAIEGANDAAINVNYANDVRIKNCTITKVTTAIDGLQGSGNIVIDRDTIIGALSRGVYAYETNTITVTNSLIRATHPIPGMGHSGDIVGSAIGIRGDYSYIAGNTITNAGYCGIAIYSGHGTIVENNIVDTFCTNKDDGGGIYFFGDNLKTFVGRKVRNNLVKNGIGNIEGVSTLYADAPYAVGIYMDNFSSNVNIYNNLVHDNSGAGVFLHSVNTDTVANNTFYNNIEGITLISYGNTRPGGQVVHDLYVHHNELIAKTASQLAQRFEMYDSPTTLSGTGTWQSNTFYRPFGTTSYIRRDDRSTGSKVITDFTIANWLSTYSKEQSSVNSTVPISDPSKFRVYYNATATTSGVSLSAIYASTDNATYNGSITLPPYTGRVLVYNGALPIESTSPIEIRFPYRVITAVSNGDNAYSLSATKTEPLASSFTTPDSAYFIHAYEGSYAGGTGDIVIENKRIAVSSGSAISAYMPISFGRKIYIRNCVFINSGSGNTIHVTDDTFVEIENCRFYSTSPAGQAKGRSFYAYKPYNVKINHCYMEQTAGNKIEYWSNTAGGNIDIRYNKVKNIDGRGYGFYCQFVQLQHITELANQRVEWNMVVNEPNNSRVEDNINLGEASGTSLSPLSIRNNFIWGAYPDPATASGFTGTGMTTDAGGSSVPPISQPHYIISEFNQFVGCMNSSMNIAAGWNITYQNNRMITSGKLQDGTSLPSSWGACAIFKGQPSYTDQQFHDNQIVNNYINSNTPITYFANEFMPEGNTMNTYVKTATYADEAAELEIFKTKLKNNQVSIGVL